VRTEGIRNTAANVIIVGLEDDDMGKVREALAADAILPSQSLGWDDAVDNILSSYPDVLLVGFDKDPDRAESLSRDLAKERMIVPLVAMSRTRDPHLILRAMRAGFSEFVVLPEDTDQLRSTVKAAAFAVEDGDAKGAIIAITGAKGGVGTSFLAAHLAAELAVIHRVLVLDLDFTMGDLAPMMDLVPKDTIGDVLGRIDQIDERSLTGSAIVHPSKVHYICQPNDIDSVGELRGDDIFAVLSAAAGAYQYVIVDCGSRLDEATTTAFNVADQVFVIATPDVVCVRDCHRKLKALAALGVDKARMMVVMNKVPKQPYLTREAIESNLEITIMANISEDSRRVDHAINEGKLIRDLYPKSEIAVEISKVVGLLSDDGSGPSDPTDLSEQAQKPQSFFSRLFGR
jgi:pilus assembly protein CpaE